MSTFEALHGEKQDQELWKILDEIEPGALNSALSVIPPEVEDVACHSIGKYTIKEVAIPTDDDETNYM